MVSNPKVGDKVWTLGVWGAPEEVYVTRVDIGRKELFMVSMIGKNYIEGISSITKCKNLVEVKYCFPALEALLQNLKDTAIYYKGE